MTFVSIPRNMRYPCVVSGSVLFQNTSVGTSNGTSISFDSTADKVALIHRVPKTGTLTAVEFLCGSITTATTPTVMRVGLEQVGTDGNPAGSASLYVANSEGTVSVANTDDFTWKSVPINGGTGVTVTKGDIVATVIDYSSGVTPASLSLAVGSALSMALGNFPYVTANTTGAYAKSSNSLAMGIVWNYGGTYEYCYGMNPAISTGVTNIGNDAERGMVFQVPVPMRISGIGAMLGNAAAGADFRVRLYDSTPTLITNGELETGADIDGDTFPSTTMDGYAEFIFHDSIELSANTTYYMTVYQRTANNLGLYQIGLTSSAYQAATAWGAGWNLVTRSGGTGAFTETETVVPLMYLLVDGVHDGSGGGESTSVFG